MLEKNGSTPGPPWSDCMSHGRIRRDLYSQAAFTDILDGRGTGSCLSHFQEDADKSTGKPDFAGVCV